MGEEFVLDRFEGSWAVLEAGDRSLLRVPRDRLPPAREGDVLIRGSSGWTVDAERTRIRRQLAGERLARLRRRDPQK